MGNRLRQRKLRFLRRLGTLWWNLSQRVRGHPVLRAKFLRGNGYALDLRDPKTFNEKIHWRKLHDRNALFPVISDKFAVRAYVQERLGDEVPLPELVGVTGKPTVAWVRRMAVGGVALKATNASGRNVFLRADAKFDAGKVARKCQRWLEEPFGVRQQEWAYQPIKPRIVAERLLIGADGRLADDIKFFMFGARCGMIDLEWDRFGQHGQVFLDEDWNRLDLRMKQDIWVETPPRPVQFERMLQVARQLGAGFDHLRVDFLYTGESFALNELTLYNGSGTNPFHPAEWDRRLGDLWILPKF
ncbi:ATP-grasp fold amidoligase family protein [Neogemmobacter tilapiae]|uniref:Glycosyl transferase n=1 Tax=Neogemmobacter tilapiae TaxID=875041 RepID=A0A918WLH5_9RHOB|nr:ATP-grasp fold amidoligase family protein [Gemmobacter tilapiae]GHC54008.1 glycosyl transferase [Gemmobacter tilapiae]